MMTLLLFVIFMAYIGLGIPDSILGAAWPAIYQDLGLPVSNASYISMLTSCGTILSSFMSGRVLGRFGTATVATVSTFMTAAALLCFSFSKGMLGFCLLAIPLGLGAGLVDTALNNYVALHYRAQHINFLHCFYGVGVSLSPYLMSLALADNNDWRRGYRVVFLIQAGIALLLLVSTPLWKKLVSSQTAQETQNRVLTIRESLRRRHALSCVGVLMGSCAIEAICLVWGATFLAGTKGITADRAAAILTFYYVGLALGRFVSGIVAGKLASKTIIVIGQCITLAAIVTIALPLSYAIAGVGLFFVGFGNGPLFPNMTHLIPRVFGRDVSQSMIGVLMGFSSVSILLAPLLFGRVVHAFGVHLFPYFLLVMFTIMACATVVLFRRFSAAAEEE